MTELLRLEACTFRHRGSANPLFEDVSLVLRAGEKVAITGSSGCGKTTLALLIAGLLLPTSGRRLTMPTMRDRRAPVRMIFQDPFAAMNPRWTVAEWLRDNCAASVSAERVGDLCDRLLLPHELLHRYPLELSGGECQRFNLLLALLGDPLLLILDEAMSMVDGQAAQAMNAAVSSFTARSPAVLVIIEHSAERAAEGLTVETLEPRTPPY
jgi:peptide/nickel transport system ATP-binding protein